MKKSYKFGISLAEIMIVVAIIAIIVGIFLAMPKKNVAKTDKAKYYAAYNMLVSFQDGRLAKDGTASLDKDKFKSDVNKILNITKPATCSGGTCSVTLINGMVMSWTELDPSTVTIDIDGSEAGLNTNKRDMHNFRLYNSPHKITINGTEYENQLLAIPDTASDAAGNSLDWIEFRVYELGENGHKKFDCDFCIVKATFNSAASRYNNCRNTCFIEAIKPFN